MSDQATRFGEAVDRLANTSSFAKHTAVGPVLDLGFALLCEPGGVEIVRARIADATEAGVFAGTDWEKPATLQPRLASGTIEHGDRALVTVELLSELRMLALAQGDHFDQEVSPEWAKQFLAQVLALELDQLFGTSDESTRRLGRQAEAVRNVLTHVAEGIGYESIVDELIEEIERILAQRPIMTDQVALMITRIAAAASDGESPIRASQGIDRLVSALYGPTGSSREDPGLDVYAKRLGAMEETSLQQEARELALGMHSTGLVSAYHVAFLHHVNHLPNGTHAGLVAQALGLSATGADVLSSYGDLASALIDAAMSPHTPQAVYGLAMLLEGGVLHMPSVAPALWAHLALTPSAATDATLTAAYGTAVSASTRLLAGVINVLGQPLGIGQGNNPTCQAARAISMWSLAAPDYLLRFVERAARDDEINMFFEGQRLSSAELAAGSFTTPLTDVDPVSLVLVPHLDRIYIEMGRRCVGRDGDPHEWINREMHGWWVGRETALALDLGTQELVELDPFVRRFYGLYHPAYNGNRPVIHPQPTGVAVTNSLGGFVGWHAISIQRVGPGPDGDVRVYFFNPNNDSGQDWGHGVVVSTEGNGERFGESSLPIAQFASRLYLYHYDPCDEGDAAGVPAEAVAEVERLARESWAAGR
ncbi:MAG: hypothetical protein U5K30_03515 [Acidimicrobiales bacterium]|nr:hypothetical protein [Acidimicrobiales bacterium]